MPDANDFGNEVRARSGGGMGLGPRRGRCLQRAVRSALLLLAGAPSRAHPPHPLRSPPDHPRRAQDGLQGAGARVPGLLGGHRYHRGLLQRKPGARQPPEERLQVGSGGRGACRRGPGGVARRRAGQPPGRASLHASLHRAVDASPWLPSPPPSLHPHPHPPPPASFYDKDAPIYTMSRFLPPSKVVDAEVRHCWSHAELGKPVARPDAMFRGAPSPALHTTANAPPPPPLPPPHTPPPRSTTPSSATAASSARAPRSATVSSACARWCRRARSSRTPSSWGRTTTRPRRWAMTLRGRGGLSVCGAGRARRALCRRAAVMQRASSPLSLPVPVPVPVPLPAPAARRSAPSSLAASPSASAATRLCARR
jgi:hypothetical protein